MKTKKIGIIGLGHVGAHVLSYLVNQSIADEIVLIDSNEKKSLCEETDIRASMPYMPSRINVYAGKYSDLEDADVLINASGKVKLLIETKDRFDELAFTLDAAKKICPQVKASGFHGIFINITNPCDVIASYIAGELGLPKGHVFGTGTGLDTARLLARLASCSGVDARSITAYMIGEHGNEQFAPLSVINFHGKPLSILAKEDKKFAFDREELSQAVIRDAWTVFEGKHCTEYGIASTAARMAKLVLNDEKAIMPASAPLDGEYGEHDVFAGVPAIIGRNGIEKVIELPLTTEERSKFHQCCDSIRKNIAYAAKL
jgi:L-lactate dehydrogenase